MTTFQPTDRLGAIYAEWTEEFVANPEMSLRLMRWVFEDWQRATPNPRASPTSPQRSAGCQAFW